MNAPVDPIFDHRARLERQQFEAAEKRERALVDQRSPANTPEMRVRTWERLHQLRLPTNPEHAILKKVAKQTELKLSEVLEVQRQRSQPSG
jgi:hypothetical protein